MTYRELLEESNKRLNYYKNLDLTRLGLGCKQSIPFVAEEKAGLGNDRVINLTLPTEAFKTYFKALGINSTDDLLTRLNLPALDSQISLEVLKPFIDGSMYLLRLMDNMIKAQKV